MQSLRERRSLLEGLKAMKNDLEGFAPVLAPELAEKRITNPY
jgi:hypothetical protein